MFFSRSFLVALVAAPLAAFAQSSTANPFNVPNGGYNATAGQPLTLNWKPTTSGTVSLILRSGASSNLESGSVIASNVTNSGSYVWEIPAGVVRGSDYTVEIVDDADNTEYNFTPYFVIDSTVTVATTSTSLVPLGAPTASPSLSSASHSGNATAATTTTGSETASGLTTSTGSASHASTSGASSTGASTTGASKTSASNGAATPTSNAGARASAAVGFLGAVAFAALAL